MQVLWLTIVYQQRQLSPILVGLFGTLKWRCMEGDSVEGSQVVLMPGMLTPGSSCLGMLQEQEYSLVIQELLPIHYRLTLYIVKMQVKMSTTLPMSLYTIST